MLNFEGMKEQYRRRIRWATDDILGKLVIDYLLKGGQFDGTKITRMFSTAVRTAQLLVDLEIGTGLDPLEKDEEEEEKDTNDSNSKTTQEGGAEVRSFGEVEVGHLGQRNPEGPTGSFGLEGRVRDPNGATDQTDDNGTAGSREVNPPQQQSAPTELGPGAGGRYSSGPEGPQVRTTSGN